MAASHGKNTVVKIDNSAGALTALSASFNEVTFPQTVDSAETTTFGAGNVTRVAGLGDSKVSLKGVFDGAVGAAVQDQMIAATLAAQQAGTLASVTMEYNPGGTATGMPKYTVETIITSYETSSPVKDVVTFSLEAEGTGAVARSTN